MRPQGELSKKCFKCGNDIYHFEDLYCPKCLIEHKEEDRRLRQKRYYSRHKKEQSY